MLFTISHLELLKFDIEEYVKHKMFLSVIDVQREKKKKINICLGFDAALLNG